MLPVNFALSKALEKTLALVKSTEKAFTDIQTTIQQIVNRAGIEDVALLCAKHLNSGQIISAPAKTAL